MKKAIQCHSTKTSDLLKFPLKNSNYSKVKSISDLHNYNIKTKGIKGNIETLSINNEKKKLLLLNNNNIIKQNKINPTLNGKNLIKNNIQIQKQITTNQNKKQNSQNKLKKKNLQFIIETETNKIMRNNSYSKTAASTNNVNTNENIQNNFFRKLINETNINEIKLISKIESLKNNIFLIKIYSFISDLISNNYEITDLEKNEEIKQQFNTLTNKIDLLKNSRNNQINIINADFFDEIELYQNKNNSLFHESNNRKLIYKTFFDFFYDIINDIVKLSNELPSEKNSSSENKTSFKKIDDITSKISSLHSKINFSKNYNLDSPLFSTMSIKNNFNENDDNIFFGFEKDNSQLISSFGSDFYQQILRKTFSKDSSDSNNNKIKKIFIPKNKINNNNIINKNFLVNKSSSTSTIINNDDFSDSEIIINESQFGSIHSKKSISSKLSRRSNSNKENKKSLKKINVQINNDNNNMDIINSNLKNKRSESLNEKNKNIIRNIPISTPNIQKLKNQINKKQIIQKPILINQKIIVPNIKNNNNNQDSKCLIF